MLKLIKYELRKNRALLLVVLGVIIALEAYFLVSARMTGSLNAALNQKWTEETFEASQRAEVNLIISMVLLAVASFGTALTIFIMGVSGYSRELNQKTSYLIFMTPKSTISIVGSKLIFTLLTGVVFAAILVGMAIVDFPMMMDSLGTEWQGYYNLLDWFMAENDMSLAGTLLTIVFFVGVVFLNIISTVSIAYLAITLSATFMRGKKGHALVSILLFIALAYANSKLASLFMNNKTYEFEKALDLLQALWPQVIQDAAVVVVSLFGCAWMLKKRVDL